MTPDIQISLLCGDPLVEGIGSEGLNLTDWEFLPHLHTMNLEEKIIEYSKQTKRKIYVCDDGEGIIVKNGVNQYIGKIREYYNGDWKIIN